MAWGGSGKRVSIPPYELSHSAEFLRGNCRVCLICILRNEFPGNEKKLGASQEVGFQDRLRVLPAIPPLLSLFV